MSGGLWRATQAEVLMIWASRIPIVFCAAIPVGCFLVVFELYHIEGARDRLALDHALRALPVLFLAAWRLFVFQAAVVAFAAFWATVDSQYGMIRVMGAQPISRVEYILGKWAGICVHIAVFAGVLILSLTGWAVAYSGVRGIGPADLAAFCRFATELLLLSLALGAIALSAASLRRTVGSGIVTALMALIGLAFMATLPFDVVPPRYVFVRYLFFPIQEFANPFPGADGPFIRLYSFGDFFTVVVGTPLAMLMPSALWFRRRDITE